MHLLDDIQKEIHAAIAAQFAKSFDVDAPEFAIELPRDMSHGDFACSIALKSAKILKKSPQEIAEALIANTELPASVNRFEFAHPGFINIWLSDSVISSHVQKVATDDATIQPDPAKFANETMIVEYSQPNIAKPLGVHHLLSTIIGQSLYNIIKFRGYKTISVNHLGDWGTQFGKLIYAFNHWSEKPDNELTLDDLLQLYVKFHNEAEKDESIEDEARREFKKLEDGDERNRELLKLFTDISMASVQKTYDRLRGIHFDHTHGESFYEDKMEPVVQDGIKKGVIIEGNKGALVIEFGEGLTTMLVKKSDGATLYGTRDLATIRYRTDQWQPKKLLYVVDIAQELHFKQVFAAVEKLFDKEELPELKHVVVGRMSFKDGKMSTRKGNIILLDQVLQEAVDRTKEIVKSKNDEMTDDEADKIAEIVGITAIKYAILSQNRHTNIIFDWDAILSLDGNSAPYMQYAYARGKSILEKAGGTKEYEWSGDFENEHERRLAIHLMRFAEAVDDAIADSRPNLVSNYLYKLTQLFHHFYSHSPVLKAEDNDKNRRLALIAATCTTLREGLHLLAGIEVLEKM